MWFRRKSQNEHQRRFRPQLEALEGRVVPAVTITQSNVQFASEEVRIVSNGAADLIEITDNGTGNGLDISVNGTPVGTFGGTGNEFRAVDIRLNGGDDTLVIDLENLGSQDRSYKINTGQGNDGVFINTDFIDGDSNIDIQVVDGGGNDLLNVDIADGIADGSTFKVTAELGKGNDRAELIIGDILGFSSLHYVIDMGVGNDEIDFAHTDGAFLSQSTLDVSFYLGKGNDDVQALFGENLNNFGNLQFTVWLGSGHDVFDAAFDADVFDVNEDDGPEGTAFNLTVWGELGDDEIRAESTVDAVITVNATALDIHFHGGAGDDLIEVEFPLDGAITGIGFIVIYIDGWLGDDQIFVQFSVDAGSENVFDFAVLAGAGDDEVAITASDNGSSAQFGVVLDGGFGFDLRLLDVNFFFPDNRVRNFEGALVI